MSTASRSDGDRAAEGVEHLQAAALEMIEAARAFLDLAEEFVADPEKVADTVAALGSLAGAVRRESSAAARPGPRDHRRDDDRDHVEHINVS